MNEVLINKIDEFKNWMIANSKKSNTVNQYIPYIKNFLEYTKVNELSEITQSILLSYLSQEFPKYSQGRHNTLCGALHQFCDYHQILNLRFPKGKVAHPKRIKRPITENELAKLIEPRLVDIFSNALEIKALIYFMFYTGLRRQEVIDVKRKNIKFDNDTLTVWIPKQGINREVPLAENLQIVLQKYFNTVAEEDNAFNTSKDKIQYMTEKIKESEILGKDRDVWTHLWRDSYACMCLEKGMDLYELKKLLGHTDIKTTEKYITMSSDKVKKKFLNNVKGIL